MVLMTSLNHVTTDSTTTSIMAVTKDTYGVFSLCHSNRKIHFFCTLVDKFIFFTYQSIQKIQTMHLGWHARSLS